jgi:hypothetical protein
MNTTKKKTPMQMALMFLHENANGTGLATAEQIMAACIQFDIEPHILEEIYLLECDRIADE